MITETPGVGRAKCTLVLDHIVDPVMPTAP
jgi:hypothetical protein